MSTNEMDHNSYSNDRKTTNTVPQLLRERSKDQQEENEPSSQRFKRDGRGRFTTDVLHKKSKKSNSGESENLRKPADESEGANFKKITKRVSYPCKLCNKLVPRFAEHMYRCHKDLFIDLNKDERTQKMLQLKVQYSKSYYESGGGKLQARECIEEVAPCPNCYIFYSKKNLFRHARECQNPTSQKSHNVVVEGREKVILVEKPWVSTRVAHIISTVRNDELRQIIENDEVILEYIGYLTKKQSSREHLNNYIRTLTVNLAKTFKHIKEQNPHIQFLKEVFDPRYIKDTFKAVEHVVGLTETSCRAPNLAKTLQTSIKHAGQRYDVMLSIDFEMDNEVKLAMRNKLTEFLRIFELDYLPTIGGVAAEFARKKTWEAERALPISDDIELFNQRCDQIITETRSALEKEYNDKDYFALQNALMCKICSFNRRRVGETQRFLMSNYEGKNIVEKDSDIYKTLSTSEKDNSEELLHFFIRGKRGHKAVPIMMGKCDAEIIDRFIIPNRKKANITETNKYLFAKFDQSLICCDSMREIAYSCGAKYPQRLTGTRLRKHLATTTGMVNMNEAERDMVYNYMGHEKGIHEHYYRLPSDFESEEKTIRKKVVYYFNAAVFTDFFFRVIMYEGRLIIFWTR